MKKLLFMFVLFMAPIYAEERVDLTIPYIPDARIAPSLRVNQLVLRWGNSPSESQINVHLSSGTILLNFSYYGQTARDQMTLLNKANLTSNSLEKRIMNKLISDGFISGTVNGSPD